MLHPFENREGVATRKFKGWPTRPLLSSNQPKSCLRLWWRRHDRYGIG